MAPLVHALAAHRITPTLILTGQHRFNRTEFGLDAFPSFFLHCSDIERPHAHVRAVTYALIPLLPDALRLMVVAGDTSSALGAALAAFTCGIPVAQIDAGLRTGGSTTPWPEEEYRRAIDANADLLFASTKLAAENLRADEVQGEVHVTGIDDAPRIAGIIEGWLEERSLTQLRA